MDACEWTGDRWRCRDEGVAAHSVPVGSGVLPEAEATQAAVSERSGSSRQSVVCAVFRNSCESIRVVLPDPKNKEKDLVFSSADAFPDAVLARNCTCLLALHHLQPTLPLHQKLPEPYASMWLKLTGGEVKAKAKEETAPSFVCSICQKTFEKEMG